MSGLLADCAHERPWPPHFLAHDGSSKPQPAADDSGGTSLDRWLNAEILGSRVILGHVARHFCLKSHQDRLRPNSSIPSNLRLCPAKDLLALT